MELQLKNFLEILQLSLSGVPIAVGVYLIVEALKQSGIINTQVEKRRAPILVALILASLWTSVDIVEANELTYRLAVETAYQGLLGALFAGLGYQSVKILRGESEKEEE